MLVSTFLLRFKANYLEQMHGYSSFSLWIPIALKKIYVLHVVLAWRKTFSFSGHRRKVIHHDQARKNVFDQISKEKSC